MSVKIQRIQSNEAGPFKVDSGRTRAHIEVPGSVGFSDLANSHIVFRMKANVTNGAQGTLLPAFIAQPHTQIDGTRVIDEPVRVGGAQALIRNGRAMAKEHGLLTEQRDQNVVSANLDHFEDYPACHSAKETFNAGAGMPSKYHALPSGMPDSPFLRAVRPTVVGTPANTLSEAVTAEVRCPLKHVDRLAEDARQFPNIAVGDITYRIELEDVRQVMAIGNNPVFGECPDVTPNASSQIGVADAPLLYRYSAHATPTNADGAIKEDNIQYLPYYVGQPIQVVYTPHSGVPTTVRTFITSLNVNVNGSCEIVCNDAIASANTGDATDITIQPDVDATATANYEIEDIFLELHTLNLTPQQVDSAQSALKSLQIPYLEHRLVKKVLNTTGDYAETLHVDAGCSNVAVFTPVNNGLVSGYDKCRNYRWSVDGNYVTNRDIQIGPNISSSGQGVGNQVHKYFQQKYYGNIGRRLQAFEDVYDDYAFALGNTDLETDNHSFFPLVMPMLGQDVIINLQLRCDGSDTMSTKEVFYLMSYPRSLNFSNGRLQM